MQARERPLFIVDEFSNFTGSREVVSLPIAPRDLFEFMIDFKHEARWAPGVITSERIRWEPETKTFEIVEGPEPARKGAQFRQMNTFCPGYNPSYLAVPRSLLGRVSLGLKATIFDTTQTPNVFEVTRSTGQESFVIETIEGALPFTMTYTFSPGPGTAPSTRLDIRMEIYATALLRVLRLIPGFTGLVRRKLRKELNEYVAALGARPWRDPTVDYKAMATPAR